MTLRTVSFSLLTLLATPALAEQWQAAQRRQQMDPTQPHPLQVLPVLLPTSHAALRPRLKNAFIQPQVTGSDHCPIGLELA